MAPVVIRPFRRGDRDQLVGLVNGHAAAVIPGVSASANVVLGQMEREPDEFIVDPWVAERRCLVAEQSSGVVAAALLLRYRSGQDVGEGFRNAGDIRWFVFAPLAPDNAPYWPDGVEAADALMAACLEVFTTWGVTKWLADGAVPVPGVYGVPEQWGHIRDLFRRNGFTPWGTPECVLMCEVGDLCTRNTIFDAGATIRRSVGINGTRFSAELDGEALGYIEVEVLDDAQRSPRNGGLADIGNLHIHATDRYREVAAWLLASAADWLRLGGIERLMTYTGEDDDAAAVAFYASAGFRELTRTERGWTRDARSADVNDQLRSGATFGG